MRTAKRYDSIDGLRTLACLGVIFVHVQSNGQFMLPDFVLSHLIPLLTNVILLFMTISAFGMCCGYYERMLSNKLDIAKFYEKRYIKLLPFFAMLCLIDLALSPSLNSLYEVFANLTLCFGLIPNAHITVIGVGWFLGTVFAFYLLFPFYCVLLKNKKRAWFTLVVSTVMSYLCKYYFEVGTKGIVYYFVYFVVGGIVFLYKDELENKKAKYISAVILIISVLIFTGFFPGSIMVLIINATILILAINTTNKGILINKFTKFFGGISFEIYLCHMLIFRVIEKLHLIHITGNEIINYIIVFFAVVIGATLFACVGKKIIDKLMSFFVKGE